MNKLAEKIAAEINAGGAIPFERFMRLALYCPVYGYYEKEEDKIGRQGDYYTSVSVGSLFGELLAFQFAQWLEELAPEVPSGALHIVEAGAHDGRLAKDILTWMRQHRPEMFHRLEYWIVEPSSIRQTWQKRTLADFSSQMHFVSELAALSPTPHSALRTPHSAGVYGIIFSNELLDALPVRRFGWNAGERTWFEWGVTVSEGEFVWTRMSDGQRSEGRNPKAEIRRPNAEHAGIEHLPEALLEVLPEDFTVELCPEREEWWRQAANKLERGKLLTIDYGLESEEFFAPERKHGTLRAYYRHQPSDNVLAHPGEQDITAHVNFTALQAAGESAGLRTERFTTQARFLTAVAAQIWKEKAAFGEWTREHARQFQTLTHPEHLGRAFKVLIQSLP